MGSENWIALLSHRNKIHLHEFSSDRQDDSNPLGEGDISEEWKNYNRIEGVTGGIVQGKLYWLSLLSFICIFYISVQYVLLLIE